MHQYYALVRNPGSEEWLMIDIPDEVGIQEYTAQKGISLRELNSKEFRDSRPIQQWLETSEFAGWEITGFGIRDSVRISTEL